MDNNLTWHEHVRVAVAYAWSWLWELWHYVRTDCSVHPPWFFRIVRGASGILWSVMMVFNLVFNQATNTTRW